ncbi:MAG: enoyl-CoA hydratase/isomerase family protein [Halomonas sp.]|jgi:enoyl-CoA hydratase/carnithine racemase|uniref:Enoyl-CoA hydratase n=1 Tax=Vreelandella aquamarina TaxID=77097 RepID=A0A6F8SVG2_9GAMM|nr:MULTISPECIES: enoyl-CoA hydratase-related protein [Halomonas]MEC7294940.1 enoyl-CoA hydratase-related protein [Pseudomonadota bacterium]MCC4290677.1 enoyl-CoA hydratase/isomerase family protein [Halomonas axialensis]MCF2912594.1 enoyl-CoA hydratase-related protein [Halomonas sp. Cn5-12]MCP1304265.1 enoyl-CoA hydratase-related protein [Halomonas sp. R1t8]MCP1330396.1 enoyl-CoA hydratase-related protein [Halomonas sp. R1t4]|tara:strand:+ start:1274 stop:2077 length:804 start_codon:yes stop_codon:yes gene_type:complete
MSRTLPELTDATLTLENRVATLTLNRHDVRNALTGTALVDDIIATAAWVNRCQDVSVLVITGTGSAFCAGGNVKDMAERSGDFAGDVAEVAERYRQGIQRMPLALNQVEVPIIAAVNGAAIGAGFDLANMADLRIASRKASFGETFLNLGIIPGDGGAWFMQRQIGYQRAFELTLSGRVISADEALAYGVVLEVVEPEQLMEAALAHANRMAAQPPKATRLTKRLMKMAPDMELKPFLDVCAVFQGMCHNEPEHLEAVERLLARMKR